jgi:hypothetical protein
LTKAAAVVVAVSREILVSMVLKAILESREILALVSRVILVSMALKVIRVLTLPFKATPA